MEQSSALNNRNFLIYLAGSTVSLHGLWIYRVALAWYVWQLTGSEAWVGVIAFTFFAPAMIFGPLFGVLADRFERRKVSMLVNSGSCVNMLVLTLLTVTDNLGIVAVTLSSLAQGTLDGAHTPVRMALVPSIVKRSQLSSAIASNSIAFNLSRVIGPAISGFIITAYGVATAFAINMITYVAIVAAVGVITINPRPERGSGPTRIVAEILESVHYVRGHFIIQTLMVAITINTVFGRGVLEMMPAVADEMLGSDSTGFAIMTAAVGAGAVLIGIVLARGTSWLGLHTLKQSLIVTSVLAFFYAFSTDLYVTTAVVCAMGAMLSLCGIGSQILIQTNVDDEVRGRVSSIWGMIAFGGTALGSLLIGIAADLFGLQQTLVAAAAGSLIATLLLRIHPKEAA
ncbi:MAG: MFS transporter [Woeseiaceae bacterium]|nr:MFS transporter [Woeseiaceae bacterium]